VRVAAFAEDDRDTIDLDQAGLDPVPERAARNVGRL
jgi:hypothetical protein